MRATISRSLDQGNYGSASIDVFVANISETGMNSTYSPIAINPTNVIIAVFLLVSFLVGTTINGLFLWVLVVRMKSTVNILWFRHLLLIFLIVSSIMPFFAVHGLLGFHWIFGKVLCKVLNALGSLGIFFEVFILTIISLDRYFTVCHPIWSQHNRTISRARRIIAGTWLVSLVFSVPYLLFRETHEATNGRIICENNYTFFLDAEKTERDALAYRIRLVLFVMRFLLAFLLPFLIIAGCYYKIGQEIKKRRLVGKYRKTFKILITSVVSFFICWLPYHLYYASQLLGELPDGIHLFLSVVMRVGLCFNFCFTSSLYLFVGQKFQQVFKTSIVTLLQRDFADVPFLFVDNANMAAGDDQQQHQFGAQGNSKHGFAKK
ncbi:probable G-protein coupled receptor 33 [Anolis sagrei]|uniref:probable G-protein coupled receptor 33 n=1 Tax=Anolis sagrei TaxID=38937 RepID=UPI00352012D9